MVESGFLILSNAIRSLGRARWFTAGAVVTFALGIGTNIAVFALVDRLLFRPLPYDEPERLFLIQEFDLDTGQRKSFLPKRYTDEARTRLAFLDDGMAMVGDSAGYHLTPDMDGQELSLSNVTYQMPALLGLNPVLGRGFTEEDDRLKRGVAMLTYEGWQDRFGGSPDAVGRRLWLLNNAFEIVGVLPPGFMPPGPFVDPAMAGLRLMPEVNTVMRGSLSLPPVVRIASGVSQAAAQAQLEALVASLRQEMTAEPGPPSAVRFVPMREAMFGNYYPYIRLILGGAGLVLLATCVSLATLFLVRARSLWPQVALRASLGASPRRLMAEALAERGLVCIAGTAAALAAYRWSADALTATVPPLFGRFAAGAADLRVIAFAAASVLVATLISTVFTSRQLTAADPLAVLGRTSTGDPQRRLRNGRWILAVEAALGVVLVAGAVVTLRNFGALATTSLGFEPKDTYLVYTRPQPQLGAVESFEAVQRMLDAMRRMPGTIAAGGSPALSVMRTGESPFSPEGPSCCRWRVTGDYFETLRIPILAGRAITAEDGRNDAAVAVLSVLGARRLWPNLEPEAAVGRIVQFDGEAPREVVGVCGDVRRSYDDEHWPSIYLPLTSGSGSGSLMLTVIRTARGASIHFGSLRPVVEAGGHNTLLAVRPMTPMYDRVLEAPRFRAVLFGVFAAVALMVAMTGLYATAGYLAIQRKREIGVRMTLGAVRGSIVRLVIMETCLPVFVGTVGGLVLAAWAARYIQAFLHNVDARDPWTYVLVAAVLIVTSIGAAWLPAHRASRTDPAEALRAK
ncbi:MAG: ABC transporter permease [Acidobacteria bacterium]|nr:ABC transporter permease [Acidobacteriota bacterium]